MVVRGIGGHLHCSTVVGRTQHLGIQGRGVTFKMRQFTFPGFSKVHLFIDQLEYKDEQLGNYPGPRIHN